ncbi:MAG: hypothetical protein LAO05_13675 [Acidobacteriia bacterium]|nr:hypothetical protein [Terriglobia bacterium]
MRALSVACACLMVAAPAAAQNLLTNGSFNGSLNGWATGGVSEYDATLDATGVSGSGSAKSFTPPVTGVNGVSQCLVIAGSTQYKAGGKILIPSGQATTGFGDISLYIYAGMDCRGDYLTASSSDQMGTAGSWVAKDTGFLTSPANAHSALVLAALYNQGAAGSPDLQVNFDDMYLYGPGGAAYSRWIPAVIHKDVPSKNAKWRSDVAVLNRSTSTANLTITMYPAAGPVTQATQLAGSSQLLQTDIPGWLGVTTDSGPLEVTSDQEFFLSGRTYNQVDATHTYGQDYEGQEPSELLAAQQSAWLPQLTENALYRTNIGITNTGSETANVTMTIYDASGNQVWTDSRDYAAGGFYQYQQPYLAYGGIASGYAKVTVNSGSGVVAYASVVDANTGDPTTITMKR